MKAKKIKAAKPKYGEKARYAKGDWVEIRGKPAPGRIKAASRVAGQLQFEIATLDGKVHTGLMAAELRPWIRPATFPVNLINKK